MFEFEICGEDKKHTLAMTRKNLRVNKPPKYLETNQDYQDLSLQTAPTEG